MNGIYINDFYKCKCRDGNKRTVFVTRDYANDTYDIAYYTNSTCEGAKIAYESYVEHTQFDGTQIDMESIIPFSMYDVVEYHVNEECYYLGHIIKKNTHDKVDIVIGKVFMNGWSKDESFKKTMEDIPVSNIQWVAHAKDKDTIKLLDYGFNDSEMKYIGRASRRELETAMHAAVLTEEDFKRYINSLEDKNISVDSSKKMVIAPIILGITSLALLALIIIGSKELRQRYVDSHPSTKPTYTVEPITVKVTEPFTMPSIPDFSSLLETTTAEQTTEETTTEEPVKMATELDSVYASFLEFVFEMPADEIPLSYCQYFTKLSYNLDVTRDYSGYIQDYIYMFEYTLSNGTEGKVTITTGKDDSMLFPLSNLYPFTNLEELYLESGYFNGAKFDMPNLRVLKVYSTIDQIMEAIPTYADIKELEILDTLSVDSFNLLSNFNSLEKLIVKVSSMNEEVSLECLTGLNNLNYLSIECLNPISSKDIAKLTGLTYLRLRIQNQETIEFLRELTKLEEFHLIFTDVKDISPLSNTNIKVLELSMNRELDDISPLLQMDNLEELIWESYWISSHEFPGYLNQIKKLTIFDDFCIEDYIQYFPEVEELSIGTKQSPVNGFYHLKDVYNSFPKLKKLSIYGRADAYSSDGDNFIFENDHIESLYLQGGRLYLNLDAWQKNEVLTELSIIDYEVYDNKSEGYTYKGIELGEDLSWLYNYPNLTKLELPGANISSAAVLAGFTNMKYLNLEDNNIGTLFDLKGLKNLEFLNISGNPIYESNPYDSFEQELVIWY